MAHESPDPHAEVQLVIPLIKPQDALRGQLVSPQAGQDVAARSLTVSGWALTAAGPAAAVEVTYRGTVLATALVGDPSPAPPPRHADTPGHERSGFIAVTPLADMPPHFDLDVHAVLAEGERHPLARLRVRWTPPEPRPDPGLLVPIMATGMPRAGTTWLMRILAAHPAVVAQRRYPYECSTAKYWAYLY